MSPRRPAPDRPTSPHEVDPRVARTHQAVREAVRRLVQRAGFEAVSHQEVAAEAGIGRATVYRHWPKQTDLLLHALAEVEAPRAWQSSGDLATDLARELQRLQRTMSSPLVPELVALIGRAEWSPELRETQTELLATGTSGLRRALASAIDRGELPADHDLDTAIARLAGPLFYRRVLARVPLDDTFVATIISAYLDEMSPGGRTTG
jgi:AcrR family transcriptional regulator